MFAVVFEVKPGHDETDRYLGLAQHLKPMLEATDGFISVERFESRRRPGWMLSLSIWRDEKSVVRWRSQGEHHAIQLQGRDSVFDDYHLRVGEVTDDTAAGAALAQQRLDETEVGAAKAIGLTEVPPDHVKTGTIADLAAALDLDLADEALGDHDVFDSLYNPGKALMITSWRTSAEAARWSPPVRDDQRYRLVRNVRDYGLFDRREAPQFCPVVHRKRAS